MKHVEIYGSLKSDIAARRFAPANRLPGEGALAVRFHAARETVRRALAQLQREGLVEKRNGIGTFVTKRGERKTGLLGLLLPALASAEFFVDVKNAVEAAARKSGYRVVLATIEKTTPGETASNARRIARSLLANRVEGVIFRPLIDDRFTKSNLEILRIFRNAETPAVLLDADAVPPPQRSDLDLIAVNNVRAGQCVAQHLFERGRRRLAFMMQGKSIGPNPNWKSRLFGVAGELALQGFDSGVQTLHFAPDDIRAIKALFRKKPAPDAVICGNDETAAELVKSLVALGRRVPEEVAVVGFDDSRFARASVPPLTTISQPVKLLAKTALKTLLARIRFPGNEPREILLDAPLVIRRST